MAAKNLYEGMFLVDSALAASDWSAVTGTIEKIFQRSDAEIISMKKWDERKLAYPVRGKERGTYILSYFNAEGPKISDIEKDINLSEEIMRALILKTDKMSEEDLARETPDEINLRRAEQAASESSEDAEANDESMDSSEDTDDENEGNEDENDEDVDEDND